MQTPAVRPVDDHATKGRPWSENAFIPTAADRLGSPLARHVAAVALFARMGKDLPSVEKDYPSDLAALAWDRLPQRLMGFDRKATQQLFERANAHCRQLFFEIHSAEPDRGREVWTHQ